MQMTASLDRGTQSGSKCPQCTYWTLLYGQPDVQHLKIQYHDISAGGDLHRDVRGGFQLVGHCIWCHLPGAPPETHTVSGIQGGVGIHFRDGPLQVISWHISGN